MMVVWIKVVAVKIEVVAFSMYFVGSTEFPMD